jgi:heme-degrading monooxygenase HmoA
MRARVVTLKVSPLDMDEVVRIYRDSVLPTAKPQPGFEGALLLTDRDSGVGVSISLWKTEAEKEAGETGDYYQKQLDKFAALFTRRLSVSITKSARWCRRRCQVRLPARGIRGGVVGQLRKAVVPIGIGV